MAKAPLCPTQIAKRICSWFRSKRGEDLSFGEILDKYCEKGMGRKYVAKYLMDMKGKDGSKLGDAISIKTTPLWEAWKREVELGQCSFSFNSKFPGNQYHGNRGLSRHHKKITIHKHMSRLVIQYVCLKCNCKHIASNPVGKGPKFLLALKAHQCPQCRQYGTMEASFEVEGNKIKKAVVENKECIIN